MTAATSSSKKKVDKTLVAALSDAPAGQAAGDSPVPLGRALAATEKRTRDKAMGSVEAWMAESADRSELDYLRLWKALWYAMYMTDKPGPQEQLSFQLASLVRVLLAGGGGSGVGVLGCAGPGA
jgi:hypothetical protein